MMAWYKVEFYVQAANGDLPPGESVELIKWLRTHDALVFDEVALYGPYTKADHGDLHGPTVVTEGDFPNGVNL